MEINPRDIKNWSHLGSWAILVLHIVKATKMHDNLTKLQEALHDNLLEMFDVTEPLTVSHQEGRTYIWFTFFSSDAENIRMFLAYDEYNDEYLCWTTMAELEKPLEELEMMNPVILGGYSDCVDSIQALATVNG